MSNGNNDIEEDHAIEDEEMHIEDEDSDEEHDDEKAQKEIDTMKKLIHENPYLYDNHMKLMQMCKELGDLDQLRDAREKMQELFPLTEDIWLCWIGDEIKFRDTKDEAERMKIVALFEKAVKDYLSVAIWLEYIQFCIGGLDLDDGITTVREVCERALTHAGLHVSKGSMLWEAYREFENVILAQILPADGVLNDRDINGKIDAQTKRITALFKRQISVPLLDMKHTLSEYKDWISGDLDKYTQQIYQKAVMKLVTYEQLEIKLNEDNPNDPGHYGIYLEYLDYEISESDPARVQCLFERAIAENCLKDDLWIKYLSYLESKLKIRDIILNVYERSVRNCPWSCAIWSRYMIALERYSQHNDIRDVFNQAILSSATSSGESLTLWTQYCDYLRRQIDWNAEHSVELDRFRHATQTAINELYNAYGVDGDPTCSLQSFLAHIEASRCKDMAKARELWQQIMSSGHGNDLSMWLEYFNLERAYGNSKHCRKILQQALNSVRDGTEVIADVFLFFERCEGSLEQYEDAKVRCKAQLAIVAERKNMAVEKETRSAEMKKSANVQPRNTKAIPSKNTVSDIKSTQVTKRKLHTSQSPDNSNTFKEPCPVGKISGHDTVTKPKKPRIDSQGNDHESINKHSASTPSDSDKSKRTVFVSNLPFTLQEDNLAGLFAKCGELSDVRLVKTAKGTSRGFAYVEFTTKESYEKALLMDRQTVEGRPMYVSIFKEKEREPAFKYANVMEKKKLFVSGLPFTCTKEALENIFSEHGELKEVRLVTYRSGAPKGLAYIEFADEAAASQAVLKTDGLLIGDHKIDVAISNPPSRKQPLKSRDAVVSSLGSGKKETEQRGKVRTQLAMMPRAVSRSTAVAISSAFIDPDNQQPPSSDNSTSGEAKTTKMSNQDFRNLFMKK